MRISFVALAFALAGCGLPAGEMEARWEGVDGPGKVTAAAKASYCEGTGRILVVATEGDRAVGILWREVPLRPDSLPVLPPSDTTGIRYAEVALRYLHLADVRGFQGTRGTFRVTEGDGRTISGEVDAMLQAVGKPDSMHFEATFKQVPVVSDTTLCQA